MMDEMWMRGWNDSHARFCAEVGKGCDALLGSISRLRRRRNDRDSSLRRRAGLPN